MDDDPLFASTVTFDHLRRRRQIAGSLVFLVGMATLLIGVIGAQAQISIGVIVGVGGFLMMLGGAWWTLRRTHN